MKPILECLPKSLSFTFFGKPWLKKKQQKKKTVAEDRSGFEDIMEIRSITLILSHIYV